MRIYVLELSNFQKNLVSLQQNKQRKVALIAGIAVKNATIVSSIQFKDRKK